MLSTEFEHVELLKRRGNRGFARFQPGRNDPARYKRPNPKSTPREIVGSHGHRPHGTSILWPALYEHLRRKGYSKAKAAAISNSAWKKKRVGMRTNAPTSARGLLKSDFPYADLVTKAGRRRRRRGRGRKPKLGTGQRFEALSGELRARGARDPDALAAYIGRKKFGRKRFRDLARKSEQLYEGEIAKIDEDKRLVFGWAYVAYDADGELVVDKSGEFVDDVGELETAAYSFVLKSRTGDTDHSNEITSTLIESMVFTPEKIEKMGIPEDAVPQGWWCGFRVEDDDAWESVKTGKRTAFSIFGRSVKEAV